MTSEKLRPAALASEDNRIPMTRVLWIVLILLTGCASYPTPGTPLRVLIYNVHAGRDAAGADNLERVAAVIADSGADVVLLQEVDRGTSRSGGVDQLAQLMRLTGFHGAFGKSLDFQGGEYGIAVLSRWPIAASEVIPLRIDPPQPRAGGSLEPRIAFLVETITPAGPLAVVNTHFDASRDERWRLQETTDLLEALAERMEIALAGGDFNSEPGSAVHQRLVDGGLRDAWLECGLGPALTFPAAGPVKRIDYVFLADDTRCNGARVLDSDASDHRPLLVEIQ